LTTSLADGKKIALAVLDSFHTCPIAEIARLGRTLRAWRDQFLAYFSTGRASSGTEAINGMIELQRRIARAASSRTNPARRRSRRLANPPNDIQEDDYAPKQGRLPLITRRR